MTWSVKKSENHFQTIAGEEGEERMGEGMEGMGIGAGDVGGFVLFPKGERELGCFVRFRGSH